MTVIPSFCTDRKPQYSSDSSSPFVPLSVMQARLHSLKYEKPAISQTSCSSIFDLNCFISVVCSFHLLLLSHSAMKRSSFPTGYILPKL